MSGHQLISVTISPTSAPAQGGPVQFVATGHYNSAPYTVTPLTATWGITTFPQSLGTVTQNGLAACIKGASGTTTVEAWVMLSATGPNCACVDSAGRPCCNNVGGSAQLTCP
jgi:hypothetical protein